MAITYAFNGKPIRRTTALARVIDAWNANGHHQPAEYFYTAEQQSHEGYLAREVVEGNCEGLTIRHPNEEGGQ